MVLIIFSFGIKGCIIKVNGKGKKLENMDVKEIVGKVAKGISSDLKIRILTLKRRGRNIGKSSVPASSLFWNIRGASFDCINFVVATNLVILYMIQANEKVLTEILRLKVFLGYTNR